MSILQIAEVVCESSTVRKVSGCEGIRELTVSRQALCQAVRTVVRRVGVGLLLGIAGAFAVTLLSWVASSMTASADEEPATPLVNVVDTDDALGLVHNTVHDTVHDAVDTVTTKVLPPEARVLTSANPVVANSLDQTLTGVEKTFGSLAPEQKHRSVQDTGTVRKAAAPVVVPSPPPEKHVISPPVHRPPVPVKAVVPAHSAPPAAEHQPAPANDQPEAPISPVPGTQWGVPSAPAPGGGAGSGLHSPDTSAFDGGVSPFWTGRAVYRPMPSTGPVVFRTVNAQPGVTPD